MAIRLYRAYSPGTRSKSVSYFDDLSKVKPEKSLTVGKKACGGRNNRGVITVRGRGGGHKRKYRMIDFQRKSNLAAKVATIEYDPNRTARISLLHYADGEKRYILTPEGLNLGDTVVSGDHVEIKSGNALPMKNIPVGTILHCVEMRKGKGAQIGRSAGTSIQLMAKDDKYAQLRMRSGEIRKIRVECMATIGSVGNAQHMNVDLGKAGRKRWQGVRPTVRGVVMNPVDHPHGGGEGRTSGGRHPVSPWGKPTKGMKTRHRKGADKLIVKKR
jgi:large subunit ribosomal protein L2